MPTSKFVKVCRFFLGPFQIKTNFYRFYNRSKPVQILKSNLQCTNSFSR